MKKIYFLTSLLSLVFLISSCEDTPSEAGSSVIPATDAINYKTLETDSIPFTCEIIQKSENKSTLEYFIVGKHGDEESVAILKFTGFPDTLANATVISADIVMFPSNYSLGDASSFAFTAHKITSSWSVGSPGNAMVSGPLYDKTGVGSFSGVIADTEAIYIPLNTSLVKEWLNIASDASKLNLNQGVALVAQPNSNCAHSFYSKDNQTYTDNSKDPYLRVIKELNGVRDTLSVAIDEDSYYAFSKNFNTSNQNIIMQSGVSYRTKIKFDLSRIPKHSHISNASLTLTLKSSDSFIGENSTDSLAATAYLYNADGTVSKNYMVLGYPSMENGNKVYVLNFALFIQGWINNWANNGMELYHLGELISLDRFSFYSPNDIDMSKRPKLKVTYLTLPN